MIAFVLRRLIQAVFVMVAVAFIAFMLFQFVGDPVLMMLGQDATPDQVRDLRITLGLDHSFLVQFWHFLVNAAQGEFGVGLAVIIAELNFVSALAEEFHDSASFARTQFSRWEVFEQGHSVK